MTEAFVMLPRSLLEGEAWRSLGINARRLVDFLMLEHVRSGGRRNGFLLAPYQQLEEFGIGGRLISAAVEEASDAGIIAVKRGVSRRPSTYALTWLPLAEAPKDARTSPSEGRAKLHPTKVRYTTSPR